ncbi:hypothetical protein ABB37_01117 [Leptomonas pyrrhocoris]|uniref:RIC1 C-terminal alpha solenoid region domain-containing protein n=1 Tax=Leptomonas pyrrhocoris TaxID=157538 RepID=A0A0N0VHA0_LEPPY|nr:hypothetical protein ABB37_01117 [Leptomonas pyrrhocoris]KPA84584.1 hypothetical protein ABB37_01117 [Leptomonas pyrrhocoris]|eukprot:XP_015663023.1 hypothetical protein ABB37_01117 [Leptomonas pyrrhocoris]
MQLCSGAVNVHRRDDVCEDGETVQSMAVSPNNSVLAVVTQMHLHFWTAGPKTVYLTSLLVPGTSLDDNPAMFVIWRPRQGNQLAVVTSRQVVFFEADINLTAGEFLERVDTQRSACFLHHTDSASRVCYSSEIRIEAGLTTAAAAAGPYAFLVTTTAGVVYVVGWHQQDVLHQWTTVGLQENGHFFSSSAAHEEETNAAVTAAASALNTTSAAVTPSSIASLAALRGPVGAHPAPSVLRVDPLQRHYPPSPSQPQPDARQPSFRSEAASSLITSNHDSTSVVPARAAPLTEAFLTTTAKPRLLAGGSICPPGAAVRTGEERSYSVSPAASPTLVVAPQLTLRLVPGGAQHGSAGAEDGTVGDSPDAITTLADAEAGAKSSSFLASTVGVTDTASYSLTDSSGGAKQRRANNGELSGTILHASFLSRWKVLAFVSSSGAVLLCRPSCGTNFTHNKVQLKGCVTPIVSAHKVAMNMRHLLLAVCTQAGALSCRRVDGCSLAISATPLWKGLRGLQDRFSCSSSQSLGLISAMEWSPSEELLCVAFYKHGMVLVHYSGAVVTHHLASPASAVLLRSPGAAGLSSRRVDPNDSTAGPGKAAVGCSFVAWKPDGTRLWVAAPDQPCFFSTQLSRVLTADIVGPTSGSHTPLTLLADNALYLIAASEATGRQGVRELVLLPDEYLRDQFPLLYGAVSSDGSWVACAGRRGVLIFNRDRFSWKLASKKQEEMSFSCVADPAWLRDVAVAVPALRTDTKTYELMVFSTSSVSPSHALARVALEGKPYRLSCVHQDHRSEGYVVLVDCNQVVRVFRYDAFMDAPGAAMSSTEATPAKAYVALTPVLHLVLSGALANPLHVTPVCMRKEEDDRENPQRTKDQMELRLLLHRRGDHSLVWIRGATTAAAHGGADATTTAAVRSKPSSSDGQLPLLNAVSEPFDNAAGPSFVYRCWVDRTPPVRGTVLLTHEEEAGIVLYHVQQPTQLLPRRAARSASAGGGGAAVVEVRRMAVTPARDTELLPLCVSPFDGYMLCAGTDTSIPRQARRGPRALSVNVAAHPQLALRPVLYAHRILSLLLREAMPGGGDGGSRSGSPLRTSQRISPNSTSCGNFAATQPPSRTTSEYAPLATSQVSTAEIDGRVASFLWDRSLFLWLEYMRLNDTFESVMDYFLHTALNETPPAAVPGLGRRSAVRAVIALLRNFPEFYAVVVGCVRKLDFTRWHLVLDFLGTPTAFFRECVAHRCYAEAVHLVRVIMMGSYRPAATLSVQRLAELTGASAVVAGSGADPLAPRSHSSNGNHSIGVGSLEQASQCAIELFGLSIDNGDYTAAYDLLRFMALLEDEIGMPAAGGIDMEDGGGGGSSGADAGGHPSENFLTRWLRQLTFSGAAYDDPDAAVEESPADLAAHDGSTKPGAAKKTKNQIGNYPTLVLNAARCEPVHGGCSSEEAAEEVQRQSAVRYMFNRHKTLPAVVHQEALRLLLTGYVTQLANLMETFSLSVTDFIQAATTVVNLSTAAAADVGDSRPSNAGGGYTLHLHEVFDGLHKELGLPRSFFVPHSAAATTAWNSWIVDHQLARAKSLPGVLSATNPKVWTVAQMVLYASPQLRSSVESLHRLFRSVYVYNLAFCVLLMRKSDLISLLLSADGEAQPASAAAEETPLSVEARVDVSPATLINVLGHLEALLAVPENSGYKPFLQDVFQSLPPSALRAHVPKPAAAAAGDVPTLHADTV